MQTFFRCRRVTVMAAVLITLALTAGCSRPAPPASGPLQNPLAVDKDAPAQAASPSTPASSQAEARQEPGIPVVALTLFPDRDRTLEFQLLDLESGASSAPREHLLRDGSHVVAVQNGKPYATWLMDESGVWRADPQNPGTLLRYLPPALSDGATWTQQSSGETVWFQISREPGTPCLVSRDRSLADEQCWTLTVLNRDEVTAFTFAPGLGPTLARAESRTRPARSFYKEIRSNAEAEGITAGERLAWLRTAPGASGHRPPVVEARAEAFAEARDRVLGVATVRGDLNGDGTDETIRGVFGAWTTAGLPVTDAGGQLKATIRAYRAAQKVEPVRIAGSPRLFFLKYVREPIGEGWVTLVDATLNGSEWWVEGTYGWDVKAIGTPFTRVALTNDGLLTVEWEMGDPARHTRVRQYRFHPEGERPHAERLSEAFRPQEAALVYPTEPLKVVEAAFVARWMGLADELPRYFATADAARAFAEDQRISAPNYRPGIVEMATVAADMEMCSLTRGPAQPGADGTLPFLATWGGYEWFAAAWGNARISRSPEGQPVIAAITFAGSCSGGG